ncbi:MAG: hypothetical protein J6B04_03825, partial [Clostridia bacterium]|nr:hypothetical protein [Clostridia bacterium]
MKDKRYIQLEKAHKYLEYLSSGFDPVTGYECKKEDVINKPMVSNCLKFVRDILLEEIIRYGSSDKKERQHIPFYELNSYISSFQYSKSPLSLEHIIYNINTLIDEDKYNILKLEDLINFLLAE